MRVNDIANACNSYFNFPEELRNWKTNSWKTNSLAVLKVISLATVLVPLGFFIARSICLKGRVTQNPASPQIDRITAVAEETLPVDNNKYDPAKFKDNREVYNHINVLLEKGDYDGATAFADSITVAHLQGEAQESIRYHLAKNGQLERALLSLHGKEYLLAPLSRRLARNGHIEEAIDVVKKIPDDTLQQARHDKTSVIGTILRRMPDTHPLRDSFKDYVEERNTTLAAAREKKFTDTLAEVMDLVQKGNFTEAKNFTYNLSPNPEKRWIALRAIAVAIAKNENENTEFPKTQALDIVDGIQNEKEIRAAFRDIIKIFLETNFLATALVHFNTVSSVYPPGSFGDGQLREDIVNHFSVALAQNGQFELALAQLKRIPKRKHDGISDKATADLSREFAKKGATELALKLADEIGNPKMQQETRKYICWSLLKTRQVEKVISLIASLLEESTRDSTCVELSKKLAKRGKFSDARMLANTITQTQLKDDVLAYINKKESQ